MAETPSADERDEAIGLKIVVDPPTLEAPPLSALQAYWHAKRGTRPMPARHDLDPLELKEHLRNLFLLDVLSDGDFRYRLLGSAITERYGRNSTGRRVSEVYAEMPEILDWYLRMLRLVAVQRRPVLALAPLRAVKKEFVRTQALHLPLSDDGVRVNMIVGAAHFTVQGQAAR